MRISKIEITFTPSNEGINCDDFEELKSKVFTQLNEQIDSFQFEILKVNEADKFTQLIH